MISELKQKYYSESQVYQENGYYDRPAFIEWMLHLHLQYNSMRQALAPIEDELDSMKETKFCINTSREFIEKERKEEFLNKLTFQYSLNKINKEKMYGQMIEASARLYPRITYEGKQFTAHQYSPTRVRNNRRSFILYKQIPPPEHKESIKRYSQLLSKKKQKQGGLDSFWIFKKEVASEQKKVRVKKNQAQDTSTEVTSENKLEQAFCKILAWGKLPTDLETGLISKNLLKNYLSSIVGDSFAEWFINFFQIRSYLNYKEFQTLTQKFKRMTLRQSHLISFELYDQNGDGFICPRDVFSVFERQLDPSIEEDVLLIAHFTRANSGREQEMNEKFKIEHVVIRDDWLTVKDYEMFFKKVDEPYLKATNKKDTGFSKTFAVLDHREKVRSTRKELNQKRMMYNDLFGEITKERRNRAFIDSENYKLNFTFFHEVFSLHQTKLFLYFCTKILGVFPAE